MTSLRVLPGVCGLETVVLAHKTGDKRFSVSFRTACPMVEALGADLAELTLVELFRPFTENPVYRRAASHLRHSACPVPCAVLKAVEVEAGMALPRAVEFRFLEETATDRPY